MIDIANEPEFDFGSEEYLQFFSRFGLSPFQHPDWLQPFYRRLPEAAGQKPLIVVAREAGELRAVIPLLNGDTGGTPDVTFAFLSVTDYACPVIDPAIRKDLSLSKILTRLVGDHTLEIQPIHCDHVEIWRELTGGSPAPMDYGSHAVAVENAGIGQHPVKHAHLRGLGRKARRLADHGVVRFELVTGSEARAAIEKARAFRTGRFPGDPLQVEPSASFYGDVAASMGGLPRTFRLLCGDDLVAVMFGLVHATRFHYIILACDYANFAKYSPGLLIMEMGIEAWAKSGGDIFDFTIGDEPFKSSFGCMRTPMYSIAIGSSSTR